MTAYPKFRVDWASTVGAMLGSSRRAAMCAEPKPCTWYAAMYGRALACITRLRTRRATNGV